MRAKAANCGFFDGYDDFMRGDEVADHFFVQRLGKAQVCNGRAKALCVQRLRRLDRFGQSRTERQDSDLLAFTHDPALTDFELLRHFG